MDTLKPRRSRGWRLGWLWILESVVVLAASFWVFDHRHNPAALVFDLLIALSLTYTLLMLIRMGRALFDPSLSPEVDLEAPEAEKEAVEKALLIEGLKELESDLELGKVDPKDYEQLKASATERALAIIRKQQAEKTHWEAEAKAQIRALLGDTEFAPEASVDAEASENAPSGENAEAGSNAPGEATKALNAAQNLRPAHPALFDDRPVTEQDGACSGCQGQLPQGARYCPSCGRPLESKEAR